MPYLHPLKRLRGMDTDNFAFTFSGLKPILTTLESCISRRILRGVNFDLTFHGTENPSPDTDPLYRFGLHWKRHVKNYGKTTAKISRHLSYGAEKETVKPNSV